MLLEASEILNKPVLTLGDNISLGKISEIIVDPENGHISGFLISQLFAQPQVVAETEVLDLTKTGLIVASEDALAKPSDIIKIQEILSKGIKILNARAETESKKALGKVENFLIDTESASVVKFYIRGGIFSPSLVLPSDKVIKIEKGKIIFSDDLTESPKATQAVTT